MASSSRLASPEDRDQRTPTWLPGKRRPASICAALLCPGARRCWGAAGAGGGAIEPACTQDPRRPAGPPTDAQTKSLAIQTLDSVMAQEPEEELLQILHIPHATRTLRYSEGLHQPHHRARDPGLDLGKGLTYLGRGLLRLVPWRHGVGAAHVTTC